MPRTITTLAFVAVTASASSSMGQLQYLINDRANNVVERVIDRNNNGVIDEPGELNVFFSAANTAGTPGPNNPTCLDISPNGTVIMGDQGLRDIFRFADLNSDGDCNDAGESIVFADASNASGVSFAFPTGAAFDSLGRVYLVNSGNTFGNDGIYRLVDLNGDGDAEDAGEITDWVGVPFFGPGNGPLSPQEMFFDENDVAYMHHSSATTAAVYRFEDLNGNGRADDPGEAAIFWNGSNAAGTPANAGFPIEPDRARLHALYIGQTATGSNDQIVRLIDLNGDGDAQDAGESAIVFATAESGFTHIDIVSFPNGQILVTDNSGKRVIVLTDVNADGDFMDAGERADYLANTMGVLGDVRQMTILPVPGDVNGDSFRDLSDLAPFVSVLLGQDNSPNHVLRSDLNFDGKAQGGDIARMVSLQLGPGL